MARWEVLHAGEMSLVWRSMWTHRKGAVGGGGVCCVVITTSIADGFRISKSEWDLFHWIRTDSHENP